MDARVAAALEELAAAWRGGVSVARRRLVLACVTLGLGAAMLVARQGTTRARIAAAVACALAGVVPALLRWRERRVFADPARVLRTVGRADPDRTARALRALSLAKEERRDAGISAPLARLHVVRALAAVSKERVAERAARAGRRLAALGLVVLVAALTLFVSHGVDVVEGADVLLARSGVAPVAMRWLEDVEVRARPPEYLHMEERSLFAPGSARLPRGTLVTVRGAPLRDGRRVALWDGAGEVPFVDDGAGRLVARWSLGDDVRLRVIARFGDVVIPEADGLAIAAIADEPPRVALEGAPRTVHLAGGEDGGDVRISYDAEDDHGLREVHLVLRSGVREERRVLARLDGETKHDRGGHVLRARDAFVRKSHAPVEVRVEAKDNDPITGPKWGASEAITLVPPDVGEPEALRLDGLRQLRDAFVDALATRLGRDAPPAAADERRAFLADAKRSVDDDDAKLEAVVGQSFAGMRLSGRLAALLRGSMRGVKEAAAALARAPSADTCASFTKASERLVLVTDGIVRGLAQKDARGAARQLADVADDLALGASQSQRPTERARGGVRMDAAKAVLEGGARALLRLGALGRDLGEIVQTDLARIARARQNEDLAHAELAARDLAARLMVPDPSFGASGSSRRGGAESGGGRGTPSEDEATADDAEQAFNEAAQEVGRLAAQHNGNMGEVERALAGGATDDDPKDPASPAQKHARAVRDAASQLPAIGGGGDSWTGKGAAAREHAEGMARALEQGRMDEAVTGGRNAVAALDEAKRLAARERSIGGGGPDADRRLEAARGQLEPELRWAERRLEQLRKQAAERAAGELASRGEDEEALGQKAHEIAQRGKEQGQLPAGSIDALEQAAELAREAGKALKRGEADRGLEQQREAQRHIEAAQDALGKQETGGDEGDSEDSSGHADIPKADDHKGPEEFRRRVMKGLGQESGGRLRDAVRRYAEGLLR